MIHKIRFPAERAETVVDYISQNQQLQVQYLGKDNIEIIDGSEIVQGAVMRIRDVLYVASKPTEITGIPARYVKITPSGEDETTGEFGLTATAKFVTSLDGITWDEDYKYTDTDGSLYVFDKVEALSRGIITDTSEVDERYVTVFGNQPIHGKKALQFTERMEWIRHSTRRGQTIDDLDNSKITGIDAIDEYSFIAINPARSEIIIYRRSYPVWREKLGVWSVADRHRLDFDIGIGEHAVIATLSKNTFAIVDSKTKKLRMIKRTPGALPTDPSTWEQVGNALNINDGVVGVRTDNRFSITAMDSLKVVFADGHLNTLCMYSFEDGSDWTITGKAYVFDEGLHTPDISTMKRNTVALVDNISGALTKMWYDEGLGTWEKQASVDLKTGAKRLSMMIPMRHESDSLERFYIDSSRTHWDAGLPTPFKLPQPVYPECAKTTPGLQGCEELQNEYAQAKKEDAEPALRGEEGRRRSTADRGRSVKSRGLQGRQASNGCSDSPPVFSETRPTCNAGRPPRDTRGTLRSKPADNSFVNLTKVNADETAARAAVSDAERAVASAEAEVKDATEEANEIMGQGGTFGDILFGTVIGWIGGATAAAGTLGANEGGDAAGAIIGREFYAKEALKEAQDDLELANADLNSAVAARVAAEADSLNAQQRYRDDYAAWENEERAWRTADSNYKADIDAYNREVAVCNREEADYNSAVAIFNSERATYAATMRACAEASLAAGDEGGADDYFHLADEEDKKGNVGTIDFSQGASYTDALREAAEAAARATCQEELDDYCRQLRVAKVFRDDYHKRLRTRTIKAKGVLQQDGTIKLYVSRVNSDIEDVEVSKYMMITANKPPLDNFPDYEPLRLLARTDLIVYDHINEIHKTWRYNDDGSIYTDVFIPAASSADSSHAQLPLVVGLNNTDVMVLQDNESLIEIFRELDGWNKVNPAWALPQRTDGASATALTGVHMVVVNKPDSLYTVTMEREIDYSPTSFDVQGGAF